MARVSMTYGTVPTKAAFKKAFEAELGASGIYRIRAGGSSDPLIHDAEGDYRADRLFSLVEDLTESWENGNDDAGSLASDILGTLGIEWV